MTDLAITKVEHVWSKENDRWIFIQYDSNNDIVGLNFMQGEEYDLFIKDWCKPDYAVFEFYQYMLMTYEIERQSITKLDFINKAIWTYVTAERIIEDFAGDFFNK
jgi:hypothetical protein